MGTDVNVQRASLNKTLGTARMNTMIGSLICVYSIMSLQVGFSIEALLRGQRIGNSIRVPGVPVIGPNDARTSDYLWATLRPVTCKRSSSLKASRRFAIGNGRHDFQWLKGGVPMFANGYGNCCWAASRRNPLISGALGDRNTSICLVWRGRRFAVPKIKM